MAKRLVKLVAACALAWGCTSDPVDSGGAPDPDPGTPDATVEPELPAAVDADAASADEAPPLGPHHAPIGSEDLTFHVGPYLTHTTEHEVWVNWETAAEAATAVEYGRDAGYGQRVDGDPGTMHHVVLSDLEPGTVYHYRACSGDTCTGDLTFATAPRPGQDLRIAVYGDSRSDPDSHRAVIDSIIASAPSLVFNGGDVVADGNLREEYKAMHFDPTRQLTHYVPLYVAIGNHEWKEYATEVANFRDYFAFPFDPDVPLAEVSYTVTYGDAFFVVLDNTVDGYHLFFPIEGVEDPPLWTWLQAVAASPAAQAARWRFAIFHYPPASPCHEDWVNMSMTREFVIPLLAERGFHAVFAGHVHDYERHDYDGFPVFVTGGGGAGLEDITLCEYPRPQLEVLVSLHHHLLLDLGADSATVEAIDVHGDVFDSVTLTP